MLTVLEFFSGERNKPPLTYKSYQDFCLCDRICFHQLDQNCFFSTLQCLVLPAQKYERFSWLCFSAITLKRKISLHNCFCFSYVYSRGYVLSTKLLQSVVEETSGQQ